MIVAAVAKADSAEAHLSNMAPQQAEGKGVVTTESIIKPACDKLSYRSVLLPNKLKVLLISDPETDKAAAALDVSKAVGPVVHSSSNAVALHFFHAYHEQGRDVGCALINVIATVTGSAAQTAMHAKEGQPVAAWSCMQRVLQLCMLG